jgi:hypothetical protein
MFASNCCAAACSAFGELRTSSEWYGHNLLSLGKRVRKISYGTGPRKYDFLTEAHKPFNMLGSPQEINRNFANADLSVSLIGNRYWQHDSSVMDGRIPQIVLETDKAPAQILASENFARDAKSVKHDASSEFSTHVPCNQMGQDSFQPHSAAGSSSVVIKVEVDSNLYVNCDTPVNKPESNFQLNNHQCCKPSDVLLPKTHSKVNSNQNVSGRNSGTKDVDITNNRFNVRNKQSQIAEDNNLKPLVEVELDNKWKNANTDDSENEASDVEFCTGASVVEESSDSYDLVRRNCNSEEQIDLQLSQFYKFECDKCAVKQTFISFKLLVQHCRDEHQSRGCVLCCDQTMWRRDELVDHMCNHKHTYRWDKYTVTFLK